jgi:hypothetical protein
MCGESSWYDAGYRVYAARLSQPVDSDQVTLVLAHRQTDYNGGASGVLLREEMHVLDAQAVTLKGRIDFSDVYSVSAPAGAPPFGVYTLSIYRGPSNRGWLLARGDFTVFED